MALTKPKLSQNIDTDISVFNDPILVLHQGSMSANVDTGFLFNRANGLVSNVAIFWSESANSFVTAFTTSSGITNTNVAPTQFANIRLGTATANVVQTDNYRYSNGAAFVSTTLANTTEITANLTSGENVGLLLTTTGVVAGNYGSATSIPTIVVDSKGRITSLTANAVSTTINLAGTAGSGSVAGGGTLTVNGTSNQITTSVASSTVTIAFAQDIIAPGNVTVVGNLIVQGNTTTLNTETLVVEDLNITVANGAATAAAADGAGLTVSGANARLLYQAATDSWVFDKGVFASGNLVANSGTASSSTTTGALVVAGGAGITGTLHAGELNINGAYQFPTADGIIGQVLTTNGAGIVTFANVAGGGGAGGFSQSTTTVYPTGDYGVGEESGIGTGGAATDAFEVPLGTLYDCMEPRGSIATVDLNT
jgi:hypothetical protein